MSLREPRTLLAPAARALTATLSAAATAAADHGEPLRDAPMSPLVVGVLAGLLALLAGAAVVAMVVRLRQRGQPSSE